MLKNRRNSKLEIDNLKLLIVSSVFSVTSVADIRSLGFMKIKNQKENMFLTKGRKFSKVITGTGIRNLFQAGGGPFLNF